MADKVSLRYAKATLSALVRRVREGRTVVITVHGVPAAEQRPIDPSSRSPTLEERLSELAARGVIQAARRRPADAEALPSGARVRGGLRRFLGER